MISEARAILDTDKIQRLAQRFRDINEDDDKDGLDEMELMCCASLAHNERPVQFLTEVEAV